MFLKAFISIVTVLGAATDTWKDTEGTQHSLGRKPIVIFYLMTDCPLSNGYVPEMNRLKAAYTARGVDFLGILAEDVSREDARTHVREFGYQFPVLFDPGNRLARKTAATVVPEVALLVSGAVAYLGRIDNRMEDFGRKREVVTKTELRDALDAVLAGKSPAVPRTKAVCCAISLEKK